ncbi:MAG: hypothetical protein ABIT23_00315 [Nitrosospira sp.]
MLRIVADAPPCDSTKVPASGDIEVDCQAWCGRTMQRITSGNHINAGRRTVEELHRLVVAATHGYRVIGYYCP